MKNNIAQATVRQTAVQELKKYPYLAASLVSLPQKIQLLQQTLAVRGIRYDTPQIQNSLDSDGYLINKLCQIDCLEKTLEENAASARIIKLALESLTQDDFTLLSDFYMNNITCMRLAERFCIDRSSLYRKVNTALDRYILACYGVDKAG